MWPFDRNNTPIYQQYAQAYDTGNYNYFDPGQALGHLAQFIQGAPPEMQQNIYQQHFAQMPYEQRALFAQQLPPHYGVDPNNPWSLSQGLIRLGQEQPNMLQRVLGHPVLLGGALALTGLVAKHMLNEHRREEEYRYENQGYGGGYQNQSYNGGGDPYYQNQGYGAPGGLYEERREERELRNEIRREEREIDRLEDREYREEHHHHHREEW